MYSIIYTKVQICYFPTECKEKCKHPYCTFFSCRIKSLSIKISQTYGKYLKFLIAFYILRVHL